MKNIRKEIYKIGEDMVKNHPQYFDVVNDPRKGIVPRCLIYEKSNNSSDHGSVVVGINPGKATREERAFYMENGATYKATLECWNAELWENKKRKYKKLKDHPYYSRGRKFVESIGLNGPILWTELVKCQNSSSVKELSVQTIRDSINKYLFRELQIIPEEWPLIAVGGEVYKILGYRFPNRTVIGNPHFTGSYGQFYKLLSGGRINFKAKKQLKKVLMSKEHIATQFKCRNKKCQFDAFL